MYTNVLLMMTNGKRPVSVCYLCVQIQTPAF